MASPVERSGELMDRRLDVLGSTLLGWSTMTEQQKEDAVELPDMMKTPPRKLVDRLERRLDDEVDVNCRFGSAF